MAETKSQFKINKLAKDMGLKAKDLVDLLGNLGHEVTAQKALEPLEFDLLFDTLTKQNQITDIGSYLDGVTYIPSKLPKPEPKKEEPKVEEKAPEPAKAEAPKAEAPKPAPKAEAPKPAPKAESPKAEAPKPAPAAQKPAAKPATNAPARPAQAPQTRPQNGFAAGTRPPYTPGTTEGRRDRRGRW